MFNQTKFFKVIFVLSILVLILLFAFTAGAWQGLDVSKTLIFEMNINRILLSSRYSLAIMPVLSTAVFSGALLLTTKGKRLENTEPFLVRKVIFFIMFELLISQSYIQFLLIKRSISHLPQNLLNILSIMGVILVISVICLIIILVRERLKNKNILNR